MGFTFYFSILYLVVVGFLLFTTSLILNRVEKRASQRFLLLLGLFGLALLLAPIRQLIVFYQTHFLFPLLGIPSLLALSTQLVLNAFRLKDSRSSRPEEAKSPHSAWSWTDRASLVISGLLLLAAFFRLYWFLVWDSTYDPIGLLFFMPLLAAAVACGFWLVLGLPGGFRTARLVSLFAFPLLVFGTYDLANHVDFRRLSDQRLERVGQAVEAYHAHHGYYPQHLGQLVPRYLLAVPSPVFINGQDWCYQAGEGNFQLAYLTRDHWSSPYLSARAYLPGSDPAELESVCAPQVAAHQQRQSWTYWHVENKP